ncbi:MAG: radical SAM protein [Chloroflexi bacterium]|nr:radical SAM protein [Chloroflexota bacterium]
MLITELFASVQGEGERVGVPTAFVRLNRCNLRCTWCDSEYTFTGGLKMTIDEVVEQVRGFGPLPNVCITGGEPLVQRRELRGLIDRLLSLPWLRSLEVETGGSLPVWEAHDPRLFWDLDVKCPGSGMERHVVHDNFALLRPGDEIKFVLADRRDFDYAVSFVREHLATTPASIFFQPAWGALDGTITSIGRLPRSSRNTTIVLNTWPIGAPISVATSSAE